TLVSLVCEDLARLGEVADLLRAIGPTLVVTTLLDGPQLASRWTARYASVLADDPGSAVVTLTSFGFVQRSLPPGRPPSRVVSLWKDPVRGLREIPLDADALPEAPADREPVVSLEAVELTILTGWAEAVAEALSASPDKLNTILDDARAGAPWRRQ